MTVPRTVSAAFRWLLGGVLLVGCSAAPAPSDGPDPPESGTTSVELPRGAFPRFLEYSDDGALWITESSGNAIARLGTAGKLSHHRIPGFEHSPGDIVRGPDGMMWFGGFQEIGRVDPSGAITGWQLGSPNGTDVGLPAALTTGPDDAIWYTNETVPPRLTRLTSAGTFSSVEIPAGSGGLWMAGVTSGPDDALWFTQTPVGPADPPDAIGRVTTDGRYTSFPLPQTRSTPMRIASGPDGALWFTERTGNRIGRITVSGDISEFPLPAGVSPFDITAGTDGALWFTTDTNIGRITTAGQISLWPIVTAQGLIGIAAAPDGTFWLADGQADRLWHFTPLP